jgi:hypothetical protein
MAEQLEAMRLESEPSRMFGYPIKYYSDKERVQRSALFTFLYLGRDDECYNFIKWWDTAWIPWIPHDRRDWAHWYNSKKGDWMYLTGQDKRKYLRDDDNFGRIFADRQLSFVVIFF